jgi:hypothetical protein
MVVNIVAIVINIVILLYVLAQIRDISRNFKVELNTLDEKFGVKISELSDAVKFLTKIYIKNFKDKEEKPKVIPFKPEDINKIKEQLNVSSTRT